MEASNHFVLEKGIKVTKYAYKSQELPNYAIKELIVKNTFFQKKQFCVCLESRTERAE